MPVDSCFRNVVYILFAGMVYALYICVAVIHRVLFRPRRGACSSSSCLLSIRAGVYEYHTAAPGGILSLTQCPQHSTQYVRYILGTSSRSIYSSRFSDTDLERKFDFKAIFYYNYYVHNPPSLVITSMFHAYKHTSPLFDLVLVVGFIAELVVDGRALLSIASEAWDIGHVYACVTQGKSLRYLQGKINSPVS